MVRDFSVPHYFPANGKCHRLPTRGHGTTTIDDELCPSTINSYGIEHRIEIVRH